MAPAHNPPYVAAMRAFARSAPSLPLVALFETAFFDSLDEATTTYAVPYAVDAGGRAALRLPRRQPPRGERAGAGAARPRRTCATSPATSAAARASWRCAAASRVDTSFGLSPQSGLPQNNRVGDMDAFAALYVMRKHGLSIDEMARVLANESGLAGHQRRLGRRARPRGGGGEGRRPREARPRRVRAGRAPLRGRLPRSRWAGSTCSPSPAASARTALSCARPSAPASRGSASGSTRRATPPRSGEAVVVRRGRVGHASF